VGFIIYLYKLKPINLTRVPSSIFGHRLRVVALIDPILGRSAAVLGKKRTSLAEPAYAQAMTYGSLLEFSEHMTPDQPPRLIVVGCPAEFRGSDEPGRDLELQLLKLFPGVPLFIEKPIAAGEIPRAFRVAEAIEQSKVLCSVGSVGPQLLAWVLMDS